MGRLRSFPFAWFALVVLVTLGMFLLLYWHVSNTFRVSQTLTNEYARGLALGSDILSTHLSLMYDAHLVALDRDASKVDSYLRREQDLAAYLREAENLSHTDPLFLPLASLADLSLQLREAEHRALAAVSGSDGADAEALLHDPEYRNQGWKLEARIADYVAGLNRSFTERLDVEAKRELASLVGAFVIFLLSAAVWVLLMQRLRAWGRALESEMAQRREAEENLRRAQKTQALGQLATGVSHDFNNILSVVQGFVDVGRSRLEPDHPAAAALAKIGAAAQQGVELTRSLLTFSGHTGAEMAPLDLRPLVTETAGLFRETLPATIDLEVEMPPAGEACWVLGSRSQLQQVLVNLILNARDAMPEGGRLRVGLESVRADAGGAEAGWVRLRVEDMGTGMPEAVHEQIFEPFYTTKPRGRGTGLGLAVVAVVVEEHRGRIAVESEPGKGSRFTIDLPAITPDSDGRAAPRVGAGREVLVGLADAYTRELVTSALETDGYRVRTAASAQALRESVAKVPPGIALIDADLAGPHLEECLRTGQEAGRSVPVICIGGDQDRAADLGSHVLFINRPFLMSELIRLVHNLAHDHDTGEIPHPDRG